MAETPDTVFKTGCCPNATGISLPAGEYLPGDGIHHFGCRGHGAMHDLSPEMRSKADVRGPRATPP